MAVLCGRRLHLGETSVSWEGKILGKVSIRCGEGDRKSVV